MIKILDMLEALNRDSLLFERDFLSIAKFAIDYCDDCRTVFEIEKYSKKVATVLKRESESS